MLDTLANRRSSALRRRVFVYLNACRRDQAPDDTFQQGVVPLTGRGDSVVGRVKPDRHFRTWL
jgi:hypothetical protein